MSLNDDNLTQIRSTLFCFENYWKNEYRQGAEGAEGAKGERGVITPQILLE